MKRTVFWFSVLIMPLSSCSFNDSYSNIIRCENYFTLVSDFNHKFPYQDDYMSFIKSGYYETFYYLQDNGFDCHFHLEYENGKILDSWGHYTCDGKMFAMDYYDLGRKNPVFSFYHSSTIDFHIIDTLQYEDKEYKIVYQAKYLFSSKG